MPYQEESGQRKIGTRPRPPLSVLARFELDLIRARTGEGPERAVTRGVTLGRKLKLTPHQRREAITRCRTGEPVREIARSYNVKVLGGRSMFGWVRPRVKQRAREIAQTMLSLRAASVGKTYNEMARWVTEAEYAKLPEHVDRSRRTTAFSKGPPDSSDILYRISEESGEPTTPGILITAEGYDRLAGLYVTIVKDADICVDVSDILKAVNELGADAIAMRDALLQFPEFIDVMQQLGYRR
jgi:hypothetical protein